jgi:hypothetical protein
MDHIKITKCAGGYLMQNTRTREWIIVQSQERIEEVKKEWTIEEAV